MRNMHSTTYHAGQPCYDFVSTTVQVRLQQVCLAMTLCLPLYNYKWSYSRSALLWLCVYRCTSEVTAGQPCYDFVSTAVQVRLQQVSLAMTLCLPLYKWSYSRSALLWLCVYHCRSEATAGQACYDFVSTTVQVKLQQPQAQHFPVSMSSLSVYLGKASIKSTLITQPTTAVTE